MTDAPLFEPLEGGTTTEVPLTPADRSALEHLVRANEREAAEHAVTAAAVAARGLGSGLRSEASGAKKAWGTVHTAKQDLEAGTFVRYTGPIRLIFQTVDYRKPFSFRTRTLETAVVEIPGSAFALPSADLGTLGTTNGDRRPSPDGRMRTLTTTGEVDFTRFSKRVLAVRDADGVAIFSSGKAFGT